MEKQKSNKTKIISRIAYWTLLMFVMSLALITAISVSGVIPGLKLLVVQSGSMEPTLQTGSVIASVPKSDYKKGDIISFVNPEDALRKSLVTHRIVDVENKNGKILYTTKGDANTRADFNKIEKSSVVGSTRINVPYIGRIITFAKSQVGFVTLIVIPATLIIYTELLSLKREVGKLLAERKRKKFADKYQSFGFTKMV